MCVCVCSSVYFCVLTVGFLPSPRDSLGSVFFCQLVFSLPSENKGNFLLVKISLNKISFWHKSALGWFPVLTESIFLFSLQVDALFRQRNVCVGVYERTSCHLNCAVLGQPARNELRWAICPLLKYFHLGKKMREKNRGWELVIGRLWGAPIFSTCLASPLSTALTAEHVSDPVKGLSASLPRLMSGSSQGSALNSGGGVNRVWDGAGKPACSAICYMWFYEWNTRTVVLRVS